MKRIIKPIDTVPDPDKDKIYRSPEVTGLPKTEKEKFKTHVSVLNAVKDYYNRKNK